MPKDNEKIIEKIKKCLALSHSPNAGEAEAAALKAQELMLKYNLEITEGSTEDKIVEKVYNLSVKKQTHHIALAKVISQNFRTKSYYDSYNGIYFFGYETDVDASVSTYASMARFLEVGSLDFLKKDKKERPQIYTSVTVTRKIKKTWIWGFLDGLSDAFKRRAEEDNQYSLMVVTPLPVMEAYSKLELRDSKGSPIQIYKDIAYTEGYIEGEKSLNRKLLEN